MTNRLTIIMVVCVLLCALTAAVLLKQQSGGSDHEGGNLVDLFADAHIRDSVGHLLSSQLNESQSRWTFAQACMDLGVSQYTTVKYAGGDAWFDASVSTLEMLESIMFAVSPKGDEFTVISVSDKIDDDIQAEIMASVEGLWLLGNREVRDNAAMLTAWFNITTRDVVAFEIESIQNEAGSHADDEPLLIVGFPSMVDRLGFYTPDGSPWREQFLESTPLGNAFPVSSRFNPKRRHPVTGVVRAHNGIDFATPVGTPIYAQADGVVEQASRNRLNGYYLQVNYNQNIDGLYLHLSRFAPDIRTGRQVQKGELIGYTGNTGITTGPHLHYELHVHGEPINPPDISMLFDPQLPEKMNELFFSWASVMDQMISRGVDLHRNEINNNSPIMLSMRESIPDLQLCIEDHNEKCKVNLF